MHSTISLKREFLKKWIKGLQRCSTSKKNMSILKRKKAIKLSADLAMASARNGTTCWSRAIIADAYSKDEQTAQKVSKGESMRMSRSKKILKRTRKCAGSVSKGLVEERTKVLRSLIPGGEFMNDEVSLMRETLDYIISLRAQVDVMRSLVSVSELASH